MAERAEVEAIVRDKATRDLKKIQKGFGGVEKAAGGLKKLLLAGLGFVALKRVFTAVIRASQIQEDAIARLNAALRISGQFSAEATQRFQDLASALQTQTRFGDEAIISLQTQLVTFGVTTDKLEEATRATLDFAAGLKIDLNTAALLVGKAATGMASSLSRYGVVVDTKGLPATEAFEKVLVRMNEQFGGRAQADVLTFSGGVTTVSNVFGDITEKLGAFITKSEVGRAVLDKLTEVLRELDRIMGEFAPSLGEATEEQKLFEKGAKSLGGALVFATTRLKDAEKAFTRVKEEQDALITVQNNLITSIDKELLTTGRFTLAFFKLNRARKEASERATALTAVTGEEQVVVDRAKKRVDELTEAFKNLTAGQGPLSDAILKNAEAVSTHAAITEKDRKSISEVAKILGIEATGREQVRITLEKEAETRRDAALATAESLGLNVEGLDKLEIKNRLVAEAQKKLFGEQKEGLTAAAALMKQVGEVAETSLAKGFESAFDRIVEGGGKARDILSGILDDLLDAVRKILFQRVALGLAAGIIPGGQTFGQAFTGTTVHQGGEIRRFQRGGGVPAILEQGEFVMRREVAQRNLPFLNAMNQGRAQQGEINIVNVIDPSMIDERIFANGDTIINMVRADITNNGVMRSTIQRFAR